MCCLGGAAWVDDAVGFMPENATKLPGFLVEAWFGSPIGLYAGCPAARHTGDTRDGASPSLRSGGGRVVRGFGSQGFSRSQCLGLCGDGDGQEYDHGADA